MGGFAGGDEGGFWDEVVQFAPSPKRSTQKSLLFAEIENKRWRLRFVKSLRDEPFISPKELEKSTLKTIQRVRQLLLQESQDSEIEEFLEEFRLDFLELECSQFEDCKLLSLGELFLKELADSLSLVLTQKEIEALLKKC